MPERYRFKTIANDEEVNQWLNEVAAEGYEFLCMTATAAPEAKSYTTPGPAQYIHLVVEYKGKPAESGGAPT